METKIWPQCIHLTWRQISSNCAKLHVWTHHSSQKFRNTPEHGMAGEPRRAQTQSWPLRLFCWGPPGAQTISTLTTSGAPQSTQRLHGACQQNFDHFLWHSFDRKRSVDEGLHMLRLLSLNAYLFQPPDRPAATWQLSLHSLFCFGQCSDNKTKGDLCGFSHGRFKLRLKLVWEIGLVVPRMAKRKVCFWL